MSSRPRPGLRTVPVRPSLDDAASPDFARMLTMALRADLRARPGGGTGTGAGTGRGAGVGSGLNRGVAPVADSVGGRPTRDIASVVIDRLRRDPGMIGERIRCASDRHRRIRNAAGRITAAVLIIALAFTAGRIDPTPRTAGAPTSNSAVVPETPRPTTNGADARPGDRHDAGRESRRDRVRERRGERSDR